MKKNGSYFGYLPDQLQWSTAGELCNQRSGALATVSSPVEKRELSKFLKSLNISQPVWIAWKVMIHRTSRSSRHLFTLYINILTLLNSRLIV